MNFISSKGVSKKLRNPQKYLIDWEGKSLSLFQKKVKDFLFPYWKSNIVFEELPIVGTRMTFDFYNANLRAAVEVQGAQHFKYNKFMHQGSKMKFIDQLARDGEKITFCRKNDIILVEIYPSDKLSPELFKTFGINL